MRSEAQKEADRKYNKKVQNNYTVLTCKVKKEIAEEFKKKCSELGTNPNKVFSEVVMKMISE